MARDFFLTTNRIGFSKWQKGDIQLAELLWGDPDVTRFICASGRFDADDISARLEKEIYNETKYHVQYWPVFELSSGDLIGCCGLRPYRGGKYEIGFHLRPQFWGKGYAAEAIIHYDGDDKKQSEKSKAVWEVEYSWKISFCS